MLQKQLLLVICFLTISIINADFLPNLRRRLNDLLAAADFEDVVRAGDLLPADLIDQACNVRQLRFLTIGSTDANGLNVPPEKSYPYLTCGGIKIARDHMTPDDVTDCIGTIIGDAIYDVIVLDFYEYADKGLDALAKRLRNRFPAALIINMRKYYPGLVGFQHRTGWVKIQDFMRSATGSDAMTSQAISVFEQSQKDWRIKQDDTQQPYEDATYNNELWSLYKDTNTMYQMESAEIKDMLLRRLPLYSGWFEFNADGHKDIARGILGLCLFDETAVKRNSTVRPWDADTGAMCSS